MANSRSAKKRIKINRRNNIQNSSYISLIKYYEKTHLNLLREYEISGEITKGKSTSEMVKKVILLSFSRIVSRIDKAVKKKILHKNTAIRKKNNLFNKTFKIV
uniref:Small ribosomal subunit protein bS20c n=1 Tax=Pleurocladia lacustris TaxID=246121 RepID=A0A1I9LVY9_9PHAE|nr:30S ribosomal protein S20 [Pleurocladia lacustris]ANS57615.1 30S ribosomal protein S20 [Pleurocladia lacustris]ANS57759.1 30S ribosomal protein S20 [Pleurocladia lacustris]